MDLDFPVVFRVLGGVDALAQAAGRCNREGALTDGAGHPIPGRLIVFRSPSEPPPGLRRGVETTGTMLEDLGHLELFDPGIYDVYFHNYFNGIDPDSRNVTLARAARDFPETDARFRMIDDEGRVSIVVPYGDAAARVAAYQAAPGRQTLRALQPFIVDVPTREAERISERIEPPIHE